MNGAMSRKQRALNLAVWLFPLIAFALSLSIGVVHIPPSAVFRSLLSPIIPSLKKGLEDFLPIVLSIRLPRLLLALMAGASLSVSGASLQALSKNPLVNEYILGISSGAAFGASLSIVFLGRSFPPQISAFLFAVVAVLLVLFFSRNSNSPIVSLLLTGIIVSAFFSALLSLVEFFASPYTLQGLFYWLMGNLGWPGWKDLSVSLPLMTIGTIGLILMRWRMNVLSMSEEEAKSLGVNIGAEKLLVIFLATLATSAVTSVAGIVGWVGLIVPHLVRMMFGVDNRRVIPLSAALGAGYLLLADDLARGLASSFEIPVGIFTSLIGIPFFIILLKKSRRIWL
jgi:iron complex transport system permease protein